MWPRFLLAFVHDEIVWVLVAFVGSVNLSRDLTPDMHVKLREERVRRQRRVDLSGINTINKIDRLTEYLLATDYDGVTTRLDGFECVLDITYDGRSRYIKLLVGHYNRLAVR